MHSTRVIAGTLKGRSLILPKSEAVRPSRNRVLQAAFGMLGSRVEWQGLMVLDACSGSGAWGIEALSRGAAHVTFVDTDIAPTQTNLKAIAMMERGDARGAAPCPAQPSPRTTFRGYSVENSQPLKKGTVTTHQTSILTYTPENETAFNIILADPPYKANLAQPLLNRKNVLGTTGTLWCLETETATPLNWDGFKLLSTRQHGISTLHLAEQL